MREWTIFTVVASGILTLTGCYYFGLPYLYRRNLRIAEDEVKILLKGKEESAALKSSDSTDR